MPQQTINIGSAPDDGTGDTLRVGGDKINDNFTELYTDKADKAGGTFTGDISVPDEAYDATAWNGSLEVPTKNAVRDKIESLGSGITELDDIPDVDAPTPSDGDVLTFDSGSGDWVPAAPSGGGTPSGTSFPGSPSTDDLFYRTDRRIEYFYDGTRWLSTQLMGFAITTDTATAPTADANIYAAVPFKGLYDIYLERIDVSGFRSAAGEWDFVLYWANAAATYTALVTVDGSATATANWVAQSGSINAVLDSTAQAFRLTFDEISGSASLLGAVHLTYRLVG